MPEKNEIIIYTTPDGKETFEVNLKKDTVWLNLNQISKLFKRDKSVISRHIKNIFNTEELNRKSVVAKFATTELRFNSLVLNMLCRCLAITDLSLRNRITIWFRFSHTVSR